jgi:hypothetical protein
MDSTLRYSKDVYREPYFAVDEAISFCKRGSLPATAGKLRLLDDVLNKRQLNPRIGTFIHQARTCAFLERPMLRLL